MEPKITEPRSITLAGMSFFGDPFDTHSGWDEENQIGRLWKRVFAFAKAEPGSAFLLSAAHWYEVHIHHPETPARGLFEVFVGVEFNPDQIAILSPQVLVKNLSSTQYAVFTFEGEMISGDWEKHLGAWMNASAYESNGQYNFQRYDERFKGLDRLAESVLDVYVPIKKKSAG